MYPRWITDAERQRRIQRNEEMLRLVRVGTPEAMARWQELLDEEGKENEERAKRITTEQELTRLADERHAQSQQRTLEQLKKAQVLLRDGGIRQTNFYRKSQVICDLTVLFCSRYVTDYHDRTKDQMIQAARSGKQNFIEGWEDGKSSSDMRLHLINVGKSSLQELREDYEDYLRQHRLPLWNKNHARYNGLTDFCRPRNDVEQYREVWEKMDDEELANMALTLLHQTDRMVDAFLRHLEQDAVAGGSTYDVGAELKATRRHLRRGYW